MEKEDVEGDVDDVNQIHRPNEYNSSATVQCLEK